MSDIWSKADNICYNCEKPLNVETPKIEKVLFMKLDTSYVCKHCDEYNGWQDPKVGKFNSFMFWMGRKNF